MQTWFIDKGGGYVIIQLLLFGLLWLVPGSVMGAWHEPWRVIGRIVGGTLTVYGVVMLGLGIINLGRNLRAEPHPKEGATLVTNGAYRIVRHPIYSGIILGWTGWGLFNQWEITALLAFGLLLPFFAIKTVREEQMLMKMFGEYEAYRGRVRKLIPFLF